MENGPRAEHAGRGAWHDALEKIGAWEQARASASASRV